ncbi:alkaline phosphatase family protein [Salinibacterium sedimenticola]|uniref:alkaline phosphatase family protein n=1 Tax=Homoserinimonas sedimenticola TaxID=2986805 RepID=UPI0027E343AA|nr:alkaline phosphatase family protein [Salinibacterium sedimenticola]
MRSAIVLLVDGLGSHMLAARAGHARTLSGARDTRLTSGFPTTTACALATLTTGSPPGLHGIVGYTALEPRSRRILNQLNGWGETLVPSEWQRSRTVFEQAAAEGIPSIAVGAARYEDSGFTEAVLRGAEYVIADRISDRLELAQVRLDEVGGGLAYVYVPELDQIAHKRGWESERWLAALEDLDGVVRSFIARVRPGEGLLVTADHGMVDIPSHRHVLVDREPGLLDGVDRVAGEPRCLQLHFAEDLGGPDREALVARWRQSEHARSWVVTRDEALKANWFGTSVDEAVVPRIGDLLVAARKRVAYYDSRTASDSALAMVGQHGSLTAEETIVPLIRLGAFA